MEQLVGELWSGCEEWLNFPHREAWFTWVVAAILFSRHFSENLPENGP